MKKIEDQKKLQAQVSELSSRSLRASASQGQLESAVSGDSMGENEGRGGSDRRSTRRLSMATVTSAIGLGDAEAEKIQESSRMQKLLLGAWEGVDLTDLMQEEEKAFSNPFRTKYYQLSRVAGTIAYDTRFVNFITIVIIIAGALVGIQTYDGYGEVTRQDQETLVLTTKCESSACNTCTTIDAIILYIFTLEIALKFIAEDNTPLKVRQNHTTRHLPIYLN